MNNTYIIVLKEMHRFRKFALKLYTCHVVHCYT